MLSMIDNSDAAADDDNDNEYKMNDSDSDDDYIHKYYVHLLCC